MLGGRRVCPGEQEHVVGVLGPRGPHLLAVDDPLVAVDDGRGLERREIGTRIGFAEPLTPRDLTLQDLRKEVLLLILGSPLQNGGTDERVTEEVSTQRSAGTVELLVGDHVLHHRKALAAILLRPRSADPSAAAELLGPGGVEVATLLGSQVEAGFEPARRQVLLEPDPHFATKCFSIGRVVEFHENAAY